MGNRFYYLPKTIFVKRIKHLSTLLRTVYIIKNLNNLIWIKMLVLRYLTISTFIQALPYIIWVSEKVIQKNLQLLKQQLKYKKSMNLVMNHVFELLSYLFILESQKLQLLHMRISKYIVVNFSHNPHTYWLRKARWMLERPLFCILRQLVLQVLPSYL